MYYVDLPRENYLRLKQPEQYGISPEPSDEGGHEKQYIKNCKKMGHSGRLSH